MAVSDELDKIKYIVEAYKKLIWKKYSKCTCCGCGTEYSKEITVKTHNVYMKRKCLSISNYNLIDPELLQWWRDCGYIEKE